jgi:hypothetical protein
MQQPEAKFKTHLRDSFAEVFASNDHFWLPIVAGSLQKPGVPDLFASVRHLSNHNAWIEAKRDGEGLRPSQQLRIPEMAKTGLRVIIAHTHMKMAEKDRRIDLTYVNIEGRFSKGTTTYPWNGLGLSFWADVLGIPHV